MHCISPKYTVRVPCISKVPSVGCDEQEMTNGSVIPRGGEAMEASRIFSYDTFLTEFDQGWVRGHQSPSGSKNYQREDTNQNHKLTHPPYRYLYMDPSSQRSRGWNFSYCKELLLVSRDKHQIVGWSKLCLRWRGVSLLGGWCWVRTTDCNSSRLFSCLSIKAIWVFLHAFVTLMLVTFVWSIYI